MQPNHPHLAPAIRQMNERRRSSNLNQPIPPHPSSSAYAMQQDAGPSFAPPPPSGVTPPYPFTVPAPVPLGPWQDDTAYSSYPQATLASPGLSTPFSTLFVDPACVLLGGPVPPPAPSSLGGDSAGSTVGSLRAAFSESPYQGHQSSSSGPSIRARAAERAKERSGTSATKMDRACVACKARKVKCNRAFPRCDKCSARAEVCDFGNVVPAELVQGIAASGAQGAVDRVAELEDTVASLRAALMIAHQTPAPPLGATVPFRFSPRPPAHESLLASQRIHDAFFEGASRAFQEESHGFFNRHLMKWQLGMVPEGGALSFSSTGSKLAKAEMARALACHLVLEFFNSCCGHLAVFASWVDEGNSRLNFIYENIDRCDKVTQVAVAAFCVMGCRTSPHSAVLGIALSGPDAREPDRSTMSAGVRREQACRSLYDRTIQLCVEHELIYDATVENIEALLVLIQMCLFNEFWPRKALTLVRLAYGLYQDIQQDWRVEHGVKVDMVDRFGVPLFACDAITSAYARRAPQVLAGELNTFFAGVVLPNITIPDLLEKVKHLAPAENGTVVQTHEGITAATRDLRLWLAQAQRSFAHLSLHRGMGLNLTYSAVSGIWKALDQIHDAVQHLQDLLVNLSYVPWNCASQGCAELHLRVITRLDRDSMDISLLIHTLIRESLQYDSTNPEFPQLLVESETRVRKALRLVAFYSELYVMSHDAHMTYHVFFQFTILPDWLEMALQRYGEPGGPATPELEVSETELDWLAKGLGCACYYHPLATARLEELRANRRPPRIDPAASGALVDPALAGLAGSTSQGPAQGSSTTTHERDKGGGTGDMGGSLPFQTGVTAASASKS